MKANEVKRQQKGCNSNWQKNDERNNVQTEKKSVHCAHQCTAKISLTHTHTHILQSKMNSSSLHSNCIHFCFYTIREALPSGIVMRCASLMWYWDSIAWYCTLCHFLRSTPLSMLRFSLRTFEISKSNAQWLAINTATRIHIVKLCKLNRIWSAITLKTHRKRISSPFFHE